LAPRKIHSNLTPYRFDDFHCQSETPLRVDILEFNSKLTSISLLSGIGLAACGAETAGTDTPTSRDTTPISALSGANKRDATLFLNASPYLAIFRPYRPQVNNHIGATTMLTQGDIYHHSGRGGCTEGR
jgi:hypothetical protein